MLYNRKYAALEIHLLTSKINNYSIMTQFHKTFNKKFTKHLTVIHCY